MTRSGASRLRKRVEAESSTPPSSSGLKRAKDGSAFAKCEECNKDVPVALISFHNCSLDAKIRMNLEAQVVETPGEPKKKPAVEKKKSVKQTEPKAKGEKRGNNSNGRKRPPTAFFLFMNDFRTSFKEANPDCKKVSTVAKEGGAKWKSLTDEEKKVYSDRAAELKAEYDKANEAENEQDANEPSEKETTNEEMEGEEGEKEEIEEEGEKEEGKEEMEEEGEKEEGKEELEDDDV